jgi:hypothetical protein
MNPATEIVLRWLFSDSGLEDELAEELLAVLKAGCAEGEEDSIAAVAAYVEQARSKPKDAPYDEIIRIALVLHSEIAELDVAASNLTKFQEIDRLLSNLPPSEIGKRVVAARIKALVAGIVV